MAHYTPIPARPRAEMHRIAVGNDDDAQGDVSVTELLHQLRARFDEDEIKARILHYPEDVIDEIDTAEEEEDMALSTEPLAVENILPRRYNPPTPARPDESTLAKLLEISSDEWSDESYDDTTADSKLATWLASFTSSESKSGQQKYLNTYQKSYKPLQDDSSLVLNTIPDASDLKTPPRRYQVGRPGHTPWFDKHPSSRSRAVSESSVTHQRSTSTQVEQGVKLEPRLVVSQRIGGNTSLATRHLQPPFFSPFDFELESEATYTAPATPNHYEAILTPTSPMTPNLATPIEFKYSFTKDLSDNLKMHPHNGPERHVRFSELDDFCSPTKGLDLSVADSFADISEIHAYNTALKHASKSPTMIRRWKHMLVEFAGRFPLTSHAPDFSQLISEDDEMNQPPLSSSSPIAVPTGTEEVAPDVQQASPDSQQPHMGEFLAAKKTLADTILDREYASYLRKSIRFKQDEVRILGELVKQRQKTIERLEETLKRRAVDILLS